MAITATVVRRRPMLGNNFIDFSVTFDSSYANTNGELFSFATNTLFPNKVYGGEVIRGGFGYQIRCHPATAYTPSTVRIHAYYGDTNSQFVKVPTATDLHTLTCILRVYGY